MAVTLLLDAPSQALGPGLSVSEVVPKEQWYLSPVKPAQRVG